MSLTTNPLNSYSSFFSSGLLAPYTPRIRRDTVSSDLSSSWDSDAADDSFSPSSPSPSSPIALPDEESMVMDVDMSEFVASMLRPNRESDRRSATPTSSIQQREGEEGQMTPMQHSPQSVKGAVVSSLPTTTTTTVMTTTTTTTTTTTAHPRLRRRRSSLTQATSPMNAIRSPTRAAGNALHHHLQIIPAATARSRSGSLSLAGDAMGAGTYSSSLVGRMRSGSCSDSASSEVPGLGGASKVLAPSSFRIRRGARRNHPAPMPALRAPPPTAPLPALPLVGIPQQQQHHQQQLRPSNLNLSMTLTTSATTMAGAASSSAGPLKSPGLLQTSARARGLSVSSSKLGGDENRIEEEMKEN